MELFPHLFDIDTALLTKRCVIRRLREGDGAVMSDLTATCQTGLYDHQPRLLNELGEGADDHEAFVRRRIADWLLQRRFSFGVWDTEATVLIAFIEVAEIDWYLARGELRYFISPSYQKESYATEIVARITRYAFLQLSLDKLYFITLADHYAAQRTVRKVGFSREGDLRNEFRRASGNLVDAFRFGLTRETYGE